MNKFCIKIFPFAHNNLISLAIHCAQAILSLLYIRRDRKQLVRDSRDMVSLDKQSFSFDKFISRSSWFVLSYAGCLPRRDWN
jgi:hypothetical protein